MNQLNVVCNSAAGLLNSITPDTFNKVVLAIVAVFVMIIQWRMASRQMKLQEQIAKRQVEMQEQIAKRQVEMQQQIATRQAADNVSSKRQNWIDELRKEAAEYFALRAKIEHLRRPMGTVKADEADRNWEAQFAASVKSNELANRLLLRLNPNEDDHKLLAKLLANLGEAAGDPIAGETTEQKLAAIDRFNDANAECVAHLQTILKKEWERVKTGKL